MQEAGDLLWAMTWEFLSDLALMSFLSPGDMFFSGLFIDYSLISCLWLRAALR